MKPERETNHKRLNLKKQTEGCWRGGRWEGWGSWVMDIGEGMCYELFKTDESQTCTLETNNTLYVKEIQIFSHAKLVTLPLRVSEIIQSSYCFSIY